MEPVLWLRSGAEGVITVSANAQHEHMLWRQTPVSMTSHFWLPRAQVNHWLGSLIQVRGEDLYRMKGVLAIAGFSDTFVFQARPAHAAS